MISLLQYLMIPFLMATPAKEQFLAVGQGVASPSVTTLMNRSRGYLADNPAGVMYQGGFRGTLQYLRNGDDDMGAELGYSGRTVGFAAGYFQPGCEDCDAVFSGALGFSLGKKLWMGLRYEDEAQYQVGFLINPEGKHRLGLTAEMNDPEGENNNIMNYGAGYAYVTGKNTIALDYSMQELENPSASNDIAILSPSYSRREGKMQVTLGYEIRQGDESENNDRFWMGAGFQGQRWHLGVYAAHSKEVMLTLSGFN